MLETEWQGGSGSVEILILLTDRKFLYVKFSVKIIAVRSGVIIVKGGASGIFAG